MAKSYPPIDGAALVDAIVYWRATGSTRALADLVPHAEIAKLLRDDDGLRVDNYSRRKPTHVNTKVQARTSFLLMRMKLGETRPNLLAGCVAHIHYGKKPPVGTVARIVRGALDASILKEAKDLATWILESPSAESHLDRLRAVLAESPSLDISAF